MELNFFIKFGLCQRVLEFGIDEKKIKVYAGVFTYKTEA